MMDTQSMMRPHLQFQMMEVIYMCLSDFHMKLLVNQLDWKYTGTEIMITQFILILNTNGAGSGNKLLFIKEERMIFMPTTVMIMSWQAEESG